MNTWLAIVLFAAFAHKESYRTAVHAFEINELVAVKLTKFLTISEVITGTLHAQKILSFYIFS